MFDQPPLHPQSVGDIIGRGFRVFRNNIALLLRAQIMPAIVISCGQIIVQVAISCCFKDTKNFPLLIGGMCGLSLGMIVSMVGYWFWMIKQVAFIRLSNGVAEDLSEANAWARRKQWSIVGLGMVSYAFIMFVLIIWGVEVGISIILAVKLPILAACGLIVGVLGILVTAFLSGWFYMLALCALATETEGWSQLISHSLSLMMHDIIRVCGFGTLLSLIICIFSMTLSLPVAVLTYAELFRSSMSVQKLGGIPSLPLYYMILSHLWQVVVNMVLMPIVFMSYGLFYRDLKVRQEGLDVLVGMKKLMRRIAG